MRDDLYWKQDGVMTNIKNLSNSQIKSGLNYLYNTHNIEVNCQTVPFCIMRFKSELEYRKKRDSAIVNAIPYLCEKVNEVTYNIKWKNSEKRY